MGGRGSKSMGSFYLNNKSGNKQLVAYATQLAERLGAAQDPTERVNARKNAELFVNGADKRLERLEKEMKSVSKRMMAYSSDATGYPNKVPGASKEGYQAYHRYLRVYQRQKATRDAEVEAQSILKRALAEHDRAKASKTFVNSYGEATKRNITTSVYEQAQKRQQKAVLRNIGY